MTLFIKTVTRNQGSDVVQFKIPQNYTLFESSFHHYGSDMGDSKVKLDGFLVSDLPETATSGPATNYGWSGCYRNIGFYQQSHVTLNTLHTLEITHSSYSSTSSGLASVLIYKEGE